MSTSTKRSLARAEQDARDFRNYFEGCFEAWTIAGSVRRKKPEIGDVEHVVIPKFGGDGKNLLWKALDELTNTEPGSLFLRDNLPFEKHLYPNDTYRWGPKYRGVEFRGFNHEIFLADAENFGSVLAIRTGPAEFSKVLVTQLLKSNRLRQQDGYVRYVADGKVYATPTEEDYFRACHVPWVEPEKR